MLSQYLKVADVVFDGIKDIIGPAKERTGRYSSYRLPDDAGFYFISNVNTQKENIDRNKLVVDNNELYYSEGDRKVHCYEKFTACD